MDWTDALERLGVEYSVSGDEAQACCPMHAARTGREDIHPSWSMNVVSGLHHCFGCGYSGSGTRLIMDVMGLEREAAAEWVREGAPAPEVLRKRLRMRRGSNTVIDESSLLAMDEPDEAMLASRRITAEDAAAFGIRSREGAWILPIRSPLGRLWGWQVKDGRRVRNHPAGIRKSMTIFGRPEVDRLVVVESPLDCALLHRLGIAGAATFGASVSDEQVDLICRASHVVLAMDNDDPGRASQSKLVPILKERGVSTRLVRWDGEGKDFGDYPDEDIIRLVESATIPLKGILR